MVGYTTLGTNKWDEALAFYDALTAEIGGKRLMELEDFIVFGTSMEKGCIAIVPPFDKKPATVGNGVMVALQCESEDDVKKLYGKALELGGTDEGAPGERIPGFYAAYFRDLDGNKLAAFKLG